MFKKTLGVLFLLAAAVMLVLSILNGSWGEDMGSLAATYGRFTGMVIAILLPICSGIFLLRFDRVQKMNYIAGFKLRKRQCVETLLFAIIYCILMFAMSVSGVFDFGWLGFILSASPFFVPMLIFSEVFAFYGVAFFRCRKQFNLNNAALNTYLAPTEIFYTYSPTNSVLASNKVLLIPDRLLVFPLDQIASADFVDLLIEKDVYIKLKNGKKIEIVAGKKTYQYILTAINAYAYANGVNTTSNY